MPPDDNASSGKNVENPTGSFANEIWLEQHFRAPDDTTLAYKILADVNVTLLLEKQMSRISLAPLPVKLGWNNTST